MDSGIHLVGSEGSIFKELAIKAISPFGVIAILEGGPITVLGTSIKCVALGGKDEKSMMEMESLVASREVEKEHLFDSIKKNFPDEYKSLQDDCYFEFRGGDDEDQLWLVKTLKDADGKQIHPQNPTTTIIVQGMALEVSEDANIDAAQKAIEESIKHVREELKKKKEREKEQ